MVAQRLPNGDTPVVARFDPSSQAESASAEARFDVLPAVRTALAQSSDDASLIQCSALLDDSVLLTVENTAAWLDISRSATYELILSGAIQSLKVGRARRVPVVAIRNFVARRLNGS